MVFVARLSETLLSSLQFRCIQNAVVIGVFGVKFTEACSHPFVFIDEAIDILIRINESLTASPFRFAELSICVAIQMFKLTFPDFYIFFTGDISVDISIEGLGKGCAG